MELVGSHRTPYGCARLTFHHLFSSTVSVEYVGSTFGGRHDQFILCAGKSGDILIWDRETATFLHHIRPTDPDQDLTCIACNRLTGDPFAIAAGGHDGSIRIWTTFSSLTPITPSSDGYDIISSESPLSSYSPRGWPADRIPADRFLKVMVPPQRRRSPSMVSTAFLSRSSSESMFTQQQGCYWHAFLNMYPQSHTCRAPLHSVSSCHVASG